MEKEKSIKIFENRKIRSSWNDEEEEWYFSIVDIVEALTDSTNPTDYLKKLRKRDSLLGDYIGTNCPQVAMITETGKKVVSPLNAKSILSIKEKNKKEENNKTE
ncbi:MAG: hypothetical protein VB075_07415 [Petrimonas sp.]|mgnify:CR=1 FL=1|uniref:hypothetical protein n=1 Tax=Petrimonas sp. TaxID=2023866 RepID=UPI000960B707|nr:hypothetical protein [Petrimonas sp.]OJV38551.1 MAG: hypothetical protein BGO33_07140 [Bacteroidia bacterium 43-41]